MELQKIIIDTDVGSDCDDVAAIALAAWMHKSGQAKLLGVTHTSNNPRLYEYIDSIVRFYGDYNCEIAVCDGDCPEIGKISDEFISKVTHGFSFRKAPQKNISSVKLLRKLLASNTGVKLICIGPLNNIAALFKSAPDEYSPLNGVELVSSAVSEIAIMGGVFEDKEYWFGDNKMEAEFNIKCDIPSAKLVIENAPVPVTFIEFELGCGVETFERTVTSTAQSPIKRAYTLFGVKKRSSWDPVTVLYALNGLCDNLYRYSSFGQVKVDERGVFTFGGSGKQRYLIENASKGTITDYINSFENKIFGGLL